ncbi:hypothetical protein Clacol_009420 [Clathrus columnatus]|uniref:DUF3669 domain-containing protein n=1 Tax=Clathrus columnatus TaxID=1419009 RepID=A0AAV5ATB1_9AGAM|nr:hypothetical protein Clacol_009420 [Clathrus columnatus]
MDNSERPSQSSAEDLPVLQRIGAGSFATIYISHGGACAFKVVHSSESTEIIEKEYQTLSAIYLNCNTDSFFKLPRPYAFYDPSTHKLLSVKGRYGFTVETFRRIGLVTNASYSMDRVFVLPLEFSQPIRERYYPASFKKTSPPPSLCRLYFGKVIDDSRPSRFFNSVNFPLDLKRYTTLANFLDMDDADKVIIGMGEMLARLHWRGDSDGRDIEWVLGGDGYAGLSYFVIDFNQMREWGKTMEGVDTLVSAFMTNDPYYPRPRPRDPQYEIFRSAYLAECPSEQQAHETSLAFLAGIEQEQAKRDTVAAGST